MSKALTALFLSFVVASTSAAWADFQDHPDHRLALAAPAALLVVVLTALLATLRDVPGEHRRGEHIDRRSGIGAWIVALPLLAVSVFAFFAWFVFSLFLDEPLSGTLRARRIVRHGWRTWVLVIGAAVATGFSIERLDGDAPVTFAFGCIALAATRLGTRWMDRTDAADGPEEPVAGVASIGTNAPSQLPSPIQLG